MAAALSEPLYGGFPAVISVPVIEYLVNERGRPARALPAGQRYALPNR